MLKSVLNGNSNGEKVQMRVGAEALTEKNTQKSKQNKTELNWTKPKKSPDAHTHTHRERNAMIFIIISILAERFQSISFDITKSIATLILSKHQFYWYFNPINYIFTSISFFFFIHSFAVVLLERLLLLCHCSISAWKAWE